MTDEMDANVSMTKHDGCLTIIMVSSNVRIELTTNGNETPEELAHMVDEFPDAVYSVIEKAMVEAEANGQA